MSRWKKWKNIDKDCFLPGLSFCGVLPQELEDDMLYCNNSMIIIDTNACMTFFNNQFWQDLFKNVSCESGNQRDWGIILCTKTHIVIMKFYKKMCWKMRHQKRTIPNFLKTDLHKIITCIPTLLFHVSPLAHLHAPIPKHLQNKNKVWKQNTNQRITHFQQREKLYHLIKKNFFPKDNQKKIVPCSHPHKPIPIPVALLHAPIPKRLQKHKLSLKTD